MEYQKNYKSFKVPNKAPKVITKNWIEVQDQSSNSDDKYKPSKQ